MLLTIEEAADRLRVSRQMVRKLTNLGKLPVVQLGVRCPRYRVEDVENYVASCMGQGSGSLACSTKEAKSTGLNSKSAAKRSASRAEREIEQRLLLKLRAKKRKQLKIPPTFVDVAEAVSSHS